MSRIKYLNSYHNHTYRCKHAVGEDEDYVINALNAGIKEYGFSDHLMIPNYYFTWRGDYDVLTDYIRSVRNLKEKYKDKISIVLGFETEYVKELLPYYERLFKEEKINYLIMGQHFVFENGEFIFYRNLPISDKEKARRYVDDVKAGLATGLFSLLAHPEYFMMYYPEFDDYALSLSKEIIEAAIKYDVPLELNLNKVYHARNRGDSDKNLPYPHPKFWELVGKMGAKTYIGIDAHNPKMYQNLPLDFAEDYIKRYNLNVIDKIELRNI